MTITTRWIALLVLMLCSGSCFGQIYVDASATGDDNGTSWTHAYVHLADALAWAQENPDDIWVAAGTYYADRNAANPNGTGDKDAYFELISGVAILGGFDATESEASDRDPVTNVTILDGDLSGDDDETTDNHDDNSFHVVLAFEVDNTAILDGFTITHGRAQSTQLEGFGAGALIHRASPAFVRCRFIDNGNLAVAGGGGAHARHSKTAELCTTPLRRAKPQR